jgi:hypothetical protein
VGEHQLHINPQAARDLGINDGDYVYVDANPADRPYLNARPDDPFYRVSRCMLRVKYNHAYPYNVVMMKHAPFIATERSVKAHETRPDGRALSEGTGYQANFRYGSQQSDVEPRGVRQQLLVCFRLIRVHSDAVHRAYVLALRFVEGAHAFRAPLDVDPVNRHVGRYPLVHGLVRADGEAGSAIDALIGDHHRHGTQPPLGTSVAAR